MGGSRGPPVLHRGAGDSTTRYVGAESAGLGSIGDPYDNASPESCIGTINNELGKRRVFRTRDQTRRSERLTNCRSAGLHFAKRMLGARIGCPETGPQPGCSPRIAPDARPEILR